MKKLCSSLLIACLVTTSTAASAEIVRAPTVGAVIAPLRYGDPAPYTGVLFSQTAAATVISEIQSIPERIKVEVDAATKKSEAQCDFTKSELKTQCDTDKATRDAKIAEQAGRITLLDKSLREAEAATPSKLTWSSIGFAGGVVLTVASVFAISYVAK